MLRRLNEMTGYSIMADEEIGHVDDFYFDENTWSVRYMVVDTGSWLPGRKVLISTTALGTPQYPQKVISVNLMREQIENGPSIDLAKPVSRQQETDLNKYFGWPMYWLAAAGAATGGATHAADGSAGIAPAIAAPIGITAAEETVEASATTNGDLSNGDSAPDDSSLPSPRKAAHEPLIRSVQEVVDYTIAARDGDIGHVEDFFADDQGWGIHYMLVDTRNWLPGRKVLVAPNWIQRISWDESKVHVDMTKEKVKNSPEYDPTQPLDRVYEKQLYDYYGHPGYWVM